ncbi:thioredoxin family protein [Chitinophaga sp. sic0106]|uniref:thioredoxin family protein n=1 Tax=Chitinophaga sp. sic0106 TaxID=2854785 RepID=UPI001C456F99|nr:thioredoxin family protein [Chitinophaga sp. sic0106]MBV7533010.1 thioredoxin family protein [Chitinophaga sp. sic0106]
MKKIYLLGLCTFLVLNSWAQGISFSHLTYEQALATAKAQKKNIFVDVYTTWCGPCKQMTAEVFPRKDVGDYFNAAFVNLKLDAENDSTHGFFAKHRAGAFPSYFWINSDGELLDVQVGARPAQVFIDLAKNATVSDLAVRRKKYEQRWAQGERSVEIVKEYVYGILGKSNPELVKPYFEEFLAVAPEEMRRTPEITRTLSGYMSRPQQGVAMDYILKDLSQIEKEMGYTWFRKAMYRMVIRTGNVALVDKKDSAYQQHLAFVSGANIPDKAMYEDILVAERLLHTGKFNEGAVAMAAAGNKYGMIYPDLYKEFAYSLVSSGALKKGAFKKNGREAIIYIGSVAFELWPSNETVTYLAAVYAACGDYKKAYEIAGAQQFYDKPILPGILFKDKLNITPRFTTEFGKSPRKKEMKQLLDGKTAVARTR